MKKASDSESLRCFKIMRMFKDGRKSRVIRRNVTEAEAQEHCSRPDTKKDGVWFDGYDYEKGCAPRH